MSKSTIALATPLREQLDRLAAFDPTDAPVLSLYLDTGPDQNGRAQYDQFLRKAFADHAAALHGDARKSFDRDVERINAYLAEEHPRSSRGLAIFACAGQNDLFEAVQLSAPIGQHWLFIGSVPHLYPLARVNDQWPRYVALLVDTNSARLFVFSLGSAGTAREVHNQKTRKGAVGGWSQARYQRHIQNFHLLHMKEVVTLLDQVVRDEEIGLIIVACDEVSRPILMDQLPQHLTERVVDVMKLDAKVPEHEVLAETLAVLREHDADTDVARVKALHNAWHGSGLGVVGPDATLYALSMGQVEELLINASPSQLSHAGALPPGSAPGNIEVATSASAADADSALLKLANELVTRAQQQSARIRFIEDPELLADVGGVGAILRFKLQ